MAHVRTDGNATISAGDVTQATVNLALDMLNLNWSMIDADMALTQSFLGLCEVISSWTEGDGLAAKAAMRAATATAELVAEEVRGGDVMLAVQVERLNTLSVLLETALDPETETDVTATRQLATSIRAIIESQIFPPMVSMRQPELPSIYQPVLRIIFLFLRNLSSRQSAELSIDSTVEAATVFALEAADVVLDGIIRGKQGPSGDLAQIVGVLCEITRSSSSTVWLDKMVEHNLLSRSLEIVVRSRITNGLIPTHLSDILVLHLSLASHSLSAEKLAVSGILSAYSDNAIAIKAEQGRIVVTHPPAPNNVHSAWCGMLLVIKALLSNLPETDTPGFTRSDVLPFLRVCTAQLLRAMSWDGETPHSQAGINELEVTIDVFYGVAKAVGAVNGLLDDFAQPALGLLKSLRHVLSHPRLLSTLITPSTEEEHAALEKELTEVDAERDVKLLDFATTPVLAARTAALMRVARTVLVALVLLTRAWEVVRGEEAGVEVLLTLVCTPQIWRTSADAVQDDAPVSVSDDPVGVINDIYLLASSFLERLPPSNSAEEAKGARQVVSQLTESAGLLSTSQLIIRHSLQPGDQKPLEDDGMDVDGGGKRRVSLGKLGPEGRAAHTLRELAGDLRGMLPVDEDLVGGKGLLVWLRGVAEMAFGVD